VWVTGPKYYLDDDGAERRGLDPGQGYVPGGWWTCHRETEEGDLVLLYRSQLKKDLAYLIETRSAAYSILDECSSLGEATAELGWDYGCDYEVIEKFTKPLTLGEMRSDPALQDWGVLRANFRRRVHEIAPDIWNHLLDRLAVDRRKVDRKRQTAAKRYALERDIEDRLAADLRPFRRHGYNLELRERQHICRRGGRADIVAFDIDAKRYVIIELKRGLVSRDAVAQLLSYRASTVDELPARRRPIGLLVGDRLDNEAQGMVDDDQRLAFIALDDLLGR
jgi:predicted RNA-binding protein with PUA-like domain